MKNQVYDWVREELWKDLDNLSLLSWKLHLIKQGAYVFGPEHIDLITIPAADRLFSETAVFSSANGIASLAEVTFTAPASSETASAAVISLDQTPYLRDRLFWYGDVATGIPMTFSGADRTVSGIQITIENKA